MAGAEVVVIVDLLASHPIDRTSKTKTNDNFRNLSTIHHPLVNIWSIDNDIIKMGFYNKKSAKGAKTLIQHFLDTVLEFQKIL